MKKTNGKALALFILALCSQTVLAGDAPLDQTWPLELSTRYLTSNFMEFRGGRFHAGLDLKTRSREGFTVRAVEDGYISRIRCTPTAYGRVVYLHGQSGRTYVFAHLARFNDELRVLVEQAQKNNQTYRTRLEFKPGQIPVKSGQVLGISGQSGTGGPHLHFEVRDRNQRPINPLDFGFAVPDTIAPVIHTLRAWPASPEARINGEPGEWVLAAPKGKSLNGDQGVLSVVGPVAFSARMVDASDIRGHKLEPWLIELKLDGQVVYRCKNESYAFSENALQRLEWTDWADWTEQGVPREHWLHRRPANTLTGRQGDLWYLGQKGEGLPPGDHQLELRTEDHAGGSTVLHWILRVSDGKSKNPVLPWSGLGRSEPLGVKAVDFCSKGNAVADSCRLTPFFSTGFPSGIGTAVRRLRPEAGDPVLEKLDLWIIARYLSPDLSSLVAAQGLSQVGPAAYFLAADWPIESSVPVAFIAMPSPVSTAPQVAGKEVAVYRQNQKGKWNMVGPLTSSEDLSFFLDEPGLHAVLRDGEPPVFQSPAPTIVVKPGVASSVKNVTLPIWEVTPIALADAGSGVDTGAIKASLDDRPLIIEPDPPRGRLLVEWPDDMAPGDHLLHIESTDFAGNSACATYQIQALED